MTTEDKYIYLMELFDDSGKQVQKTSDLLEKKNKLLNPGDPKCYAVFPIPSFVYEDLVELPYFKVVKTLVDDNLTKQKNREEVIPLVFLKSFDEARDMILRLNCFICYWFEEDKEWPLTITENVFGELIEKCQFTPIKNLSLFINCTLKIFDKAGISLEDVIAPDKIFSLFQHFDNPLFIAMLPIIYNETAEKWKKGNWYLVKKFPFYTGEFSFFNTELDYYSDIIEPEEKLILMFPNSIDEARAIARDMNCHYFWWSEKNADQVLVLTNPYFNGSVWEDPSLEYYFKENDLYD